METNGHFYGLTPSTGLGVFANANALTETTYGYDSASRLQTVSDGTNSATYAYVANSPLVGQITFQESGVLRMTTTKSYDHLNRLLAVDNRPSADLPMRFAYDYNDANQRTRVTLADGSYWVYSYDSLGQVTSGKKYGSENTPVAGQQFEYAFDDIGNRKQTKAGGDERGAGLRTANYSVNELNQYAQRDVPGAVDLIGLARGTVGVNGSSSGVYRRGEYFRKEVAVNNSAAPQYESVTVTSTDGTSVTESGSLFLAKTPEVFGYDLDGNLTNDGRWAFTWDGENRLIAMQAHANAPAGSERRMQFGYDHQSRRVTKRVEHWTNSAWTVTSFNKFLYDRLNLVAQLNGTNSAFVQRYVWGLDLSGTEQGAGGVGGLLIINAQVHGVHYAVYDGNGNVMGTVRASTGVTSAEYEYDPFGQTLRATGPFASYNQIRFSTKYHEEASGMAYYGFRFYDVNTGRWPNRDPLGEPGFELLRGKKASHIAGGANKYQFVLNNPLSIVDPLGLWEWPWKKKKDKQCCKNDDPTPYKDLANKFLTDLAAKVQEAEAEIGRDKVAEILDKLGKAKFVIDSIKSICDARNPDGCDNFLRSGEIDDCMLCCTSIHALFSDELAGLGFSVTCKLACKNAD